MLYYVQKKIPDHSLPSLFHSWKNIVRYSQAHSLQSMWFSNTFTDGTVK